MRGGSPSFEGSTTPGSQLNGCPWHGTARIVTRLVSLYDTSTTNYRVSQGTAPKKAVLTGGVLQNAALQILILDWYRYREWTGDVLQQDGPYVWGLRGKQNLGCGSLPRTPRFASRKRPTATEAKTRRAAWHFCKLYDVLRVSVCVSVPTASLAMYRVRHPC